MSSEPQRDDASPDEPPRPADDTPPPRVMYATWSEVKADPNILVSHWYDYDTSRLETDTSGRPPYDRLRANVIDLARFHRYELSEIGDDDIIAAYWAGNLPAERANVHGRLKREVAAAIDWLHTYYHHPRLLPDT